MTRRGTLTDVVGALIAFLFAALLCSMAVTCPVIADLPDGRTSGFSHETKPFPKDSSRDGLDPEYGPLPHPNGRRSYGPPTAHAVPQNLRLFSDVSRRGGLAFTLSHGRPTAHAPPSGPLGQRPAARPAVLQVFRL
ncbi:hypothetical protein [Streptomyces sp. 8N706]|uniref:hypothetical protein n=1 Tax=Streptomyces sp. 8N706 TaxID=3457416 RepID=UPI003FD45A8A